MKLKSESVLACLSVMLWAAVAAAQVRTVSDEEVRRVHKAAILIDTHNDVTSATLDGFDIAGPSAETHTDISRLKAGGVGAVFFAAYVSSAYVKDNRAGERALEMIDTIRHDIVGKHPADFELALDADGIVAARKRGRIAALIGIEGGHAIADNLRLLRGFYNLGARYMTLTHSNTNNWADSSGDIDKTDVKHHGGLTDFGREVVAEMNRLGMMVDISHVSDDTFWDVLRTTKAPVFASHSSCRAVSNIARNMTDEMIRALAENGGVVQINFGCEFLSQRSADASAWTNPVLQAKFAKLIDEDRSEDGFTEKVKRATAKLGIRTVQATLDDVVAHIDHIRKIAGVDCIGIGSDFDGVGCTPEGLDDVSKFPNLTRRLLEKGYSADDIRKILGGNLLRVMRGVEATAARMRGSR